MRLRQLIDGDVPDVDIAEVREDSRAVGRGDLFVAVKGQTVDGHRYVAQAAAQGAAAVVVEEDVTCDVPVVRVPSTRVALAQIAANRWGRPAEKLRLVGVTGTNGKTTTAFLTEALTGGGVIGTVVYRYQDWVQPAPFTTPGPLELHATFAEMLRRGAKAVAMECSSHALSLGRLEGVKLDVAAFTNLTQDHLDFHGTMEAYRDAKALLFTEHLRGTAVVNLQGAYGEYFATLTPNTIAVGRDVRVLSVQHSLEGIDAKLATPAGEVRLKSALIGAFNLENLLVGVGIGVALGMDAKTIGERLSSLRGVPGRLERVPAPFGVFVDYAHTPDALERVMAAVRPVTTGRLIVVFGCGGDRDRTKRPKMGRAVAEMADLPIVTSDNPRTEEPNSILEMIVAGMTRKPFLVEVDRRKAIGAAMAEARPGDAVIIAGKGHEDYQIVGKVKHHFDDREEAAAALQKVANADEKAQS